jgi:pimeloyl-ACP methyl ester carboxylesterase
VSSSLFFQLIDQALSEIVRRDPSYLLQFSLMFPPAAAKAEAYHRRPQFREFYPNEIEQALRTGIDYIEQEGGRVYVGSEQADPVGQMLLDSMMDAFAADKRAISLSSNGHDGRTMPDILQDMYDERRHSDGSRYLVRRLGDHPLLLISACGIPLAIWSTLLGDNRHNFKIIVVETKNTDLLLGGMRGCQDLVADGVDIVAALDRERIAQADILAWCNGARTAIALANRYSGRFRSLTLLSPALRGLEGITRQPSAFESTMSDMFDMVAEKPKLASYFAENFERQPLAVDWETVGTDVCHRGSVLFGLASREYSRTLLAPFLQADSLANLGRRLILDQRYPTHQALSQLTIPIFLVTGDNDTVVNCAFASAALAKWAPRTIHAKVSAAGHYIHDLQYPYFIAAMSDFVIGRRPAASARVEVAPLSDPSNLTIDHTLNV